MIEQIKRWGNVYDAWFDVLRGFMLIDRERKGGETHREGDLSKLGIYHTPSRKSFDARTALSNIPYLTTTLFFFFSVISYG